MSNAHKETALDTDSQSIFEDRLSAKRDMSSAELKRHQDKVLEIGRLVRELGHEMERTKKHGAFHELRIGDELAFRHDDYNNSTTIIRPGDDGADKLHLGLKFGRYEPAVSEGVLNDILNILGTLESYSDALKNDPTD